MDATHRRDASGPAFDASVQDDAASESLDAAQSPDAPDARAPPPDAAPWLDAATGLDAGGDPDVGGAVDAGACAPLPDPMGGASTVDLFAQIGAASVVNSAWEPLPNYTATGSTDYEHGGYGLGQSSDQFADGTHAGPRTFYLLPPSNPSDFIKIFFPSQSLAPAAAYVFSSKIGIRHVPGSTALGVSVHVVVSADPDVAGEPSWVELAQYSLAKTDTRQLEVPLGLWPLRANFKLAIQISCVGNNYYDVVLLDGASLRPVQPRAALGVNQPNLMWDSGGVPVMQRRVDQMASVGAMQLRLALRGVGVMSPTLAIIKRANERGMKVLLNVLHEAEDFVDPLGATANGGAEFNALCGWPNGNFRLSAVDLPRYRARLTAYVDAIRAQGLTVDAYEIGNEYDWVCFNGDIPLTGGAPDQSFNATAARYAEILRASYEIIHRPGDCRPPAVVTFGPANTIHFRPSNSIDPVRFFTYLRNVNGVDYLARYADVIGEHIYSSEATNTADLRAAAQAVPAGKPFWVTEWGVPLSAASTGYPRYAAMKAVLSLMSSLPDVRIENSFLYAFEDAQWGVYDTSRDTPLFEARIFSDYRVPAR
ncbi:MAG: hypothetical protein HY901_32300 [Deltaproteobacteria bacterium]|nr:hypothetical protein [Deltaproteobacteria bacterium]